MSDIYKTVYSRVIERCIKDLVGDSAVERGNAIKYLYSEEFLLHCKYASYPEGLVETLDEMIQMSKVEQKFVARQVLDELAETA